MSNTSILARFVLDPLGTLRALIWLHESKELSTIFLIPADQCDIFSRCSPSATCNSRDMAICSCLPGFEPENPGYLLSKCVENRKSYTCGKGKGEGFRTLLKLKLPDAKNAKLLSNLSLRECETECLKSCSCTGFTSAGEVRKRGSFAWYGELNDIKQ